LGQDFPTANQRSRSLRRGLDQCQCIFLHEKSSHGEREEQRSRNKGQTNVRFSRYSSDHHQGDNDCDKILIRFHCSEISVEGFSNRKRIISLPRATMSPLPFGAGVQNVGYQ